MPRCLWKFDVCRLDVCKLDKSERSYVLFVSLVNLRMSDTTYNKKSELTGLRN